MRSSLTRRNFLTVSLATVLFSGCSSITEDGGTATQTKEPAATEERTETQTDQNPTEIIEFEPENTQFIPIVADENEDSESEVVLSVEDPDGIDYVEIYLNNGADETRILRESTSGRTYRTAVPFRSRLLAPEGNQFRAEVTDQRGKTATQRTQPFGFEATGYRLDAPSDPDYSTERAWDDINFSQAKMDDVRQAWLEDAAYNDLIKQLKNDRRISGDSTGFRFPNWNEDTYGHWDLEAFKNSTNPEDIILWAQAPTRVHQQKVDGGPPSTEHDRFAATTEIAIDEIHPEAEVRTGTMNTQGHGVYTVYFENIPEGEKRWWHVDTTSESVSPPRQSGYAENKSFVPGIYHPFAEGYESGDTVQGLEYNEEKNAASWGLFSLVNTHNTEGPTGGDVFITDPILEEIYNEHIPNNGKIDSFIDELEEAVYQQVEKGGKVGLYGSGLDDIRIASGGQELHSRVMEDPGSMSAQEVEEYLSEN